MQVLIGILVIGIWILIMRMLGAWMLRINDVINEQKRNNEILQSILEEIKNRKN